MKLLTTLVLIIAIVNCAAESSLRDSNRYITVVPCTYEQGTAGCKCPGPCMSHVSNTSTCATDKCFKWDTQKNLCEDAGKDGTAAMWLTAILGTVGAGFGSIGRWTLFAIAWIIIGVGGCLVPCMCTCICTDDEFREGLIKCWSLLVSCGLTAYWIWSIVVIANRDIVDGNGCQLS